MLAWLGKRLIVLALVLVTGGHWAFLQTIAWFGMAVSYSQNASFTEALVMTFDGRHPCKLCKAVQEGKKSEKKQAPQRPVTKLDLFCPASSLALDAPMFSRVSAAADEPILALAKIPPKPPPRRV
jgi:hypothetical protein